MTKLFNKIVEFLFGVGNKENSSIKKTEVTEDKIDIVDFVTARNCSLAIDSEMEILKETVKRICIKEACDNVLIDNFIKGYCDILIDEHIYSETPNPLNKCALWFPNTWIWKALPIFEPKYGCKNVQLGVVKIDDYYMQVFCETLISKGFSAEVRVFKAKDYNLTEKDHYTIKEGTPFIIFSMDETSLTKYDGYIKKQIVRNRKIDGSTSENGIDLLKYANSVSYRTEYGRELKDSR